MFPRRNPRSHVGDCWDTRSRCHPAGRDLARRALADGVEACTHCRPDTALGVLDQPARRRLEAWTMRRFSCTGSRRRVAGGS
ncbi:DUF6233 domain-containing protein [Streptomyces sp. NPDC044571]|uniref:DUF6233 domain-containing protein n=1 Tax=Streptomyces sp. NPDC044571 TaxID=3155371 RepID=UPI0033F6B69C